VLQVTYPLLESGAVLSDGVDVHFTIETTSTSYTLTLAAGEVTAKVSFAAETLTINPPVGCAFCGAMYGLYSTGKSEPVLEPADFWDVEIRETS
jgi:hypothetical protein